MGVFAVEELTRRDLPPSKRDCPNCGEIGSARLLFPNEYKAHYQCLSCKTPSSLELHPGLRPRRVVYLDQYVYSNIARGSNQAYKRLFELLSDLTAVQLWLCPTGLGHWVETGFDPKESNRREYFRVMQHLMRSRMFRSPTNIVEIHAGKAYQAFLL